MAQTHHPRIGNGDAAYLHGLLARMRRAFGAFECARAATWLALLCLATGSVVIWLDMYVHVAAGWRWAALAIWLAGALAAIARLGVAVFLQPTGERWLSVHIERRYPALKNRLVTAIQILHGGPETEDFDPEFCERLVRDTSAQVRQLDLRPIVPWARIKAPLAAALLVLLFGTILYQQWPEGFAVAFSRLLHPGRPIPVPARTRIAVQPAGVTLPRGDSLRLRALITGHPVRTVSLHVRRPDKDWTIISMLPESGIVSNPAPNGFTYELRDVNDPLEYFVTAGDGQTERFRITLVDRPQVRSLELAYTYPAYLGFPPRTLDAGICVVEAPIGTTVRVAAETDSPVQGGYIRLALQAEKDPRRVPLKPASPQRLEADFTLEKSGSYSVVVTNAAGLGEKQPAEYPLIAQLDTPPVIEVIEPGRDLVLDDPQSVPVLATARDDFGLTALYAQIVVSNALPVATNASGQLQPPGRRLVEISEPNIRSQNASVQVPCDRIDGFETAGKLTYTLYAVDRKGQVSASRTYSIMLTQAAQERARLEAAATNKPPEMAQPEQAKPPAPPEVAQIEALIEKQRAIAERVRNSQKEANRFRPETPPLAREIRTAFDQEKRFANDLTGARGWAQGKLDELAKSPNQQNPQFERTLRMTRDLMESLRTDEVRDAMDALRGAFMTTVPGGTNALTTDAPAQDGTPPQGAPAPGAPAPGQPVPPQAGAAQPPQGAPPPGQPGAPQQPGQPPAPGPQPESSPVNAPPLSGEAKKQVRQELAEALRQQEQVINKLEALKQRMEASLPGKIDPATLEALDNQVRDEMAADAEEFKAGLMLASQKAAEAAEQFKPLAARQSSIRDETVETESEQVRNLAKSEDRLTVETGHAEERVRSELPWLKPPQAAPTALSNDLLTASSAPQTPIPQVPFAPRKEALQGPTAPMPQVTQPAGPNPMPKLLVPDRFPTTFRGDLSDKPIPAPPPNAVPTGRAPSTSLRKMTDEEKAKLREGVMLDSLELLDDGMAMGLGAPDNEEMPEEMLLEPGAQFSSGPSAPDSKPGMELGQSAGPVLGNPQQPPTGGGGGGGGGPPGAPPPPGQKSNPANQPPNQSQSPGSQPGPSSGPPQGQPPGQQPPSQPGGGTAGGGSGPQGLTPPQPPSVAAMRRATASLAAADRTTALKSEDTALAELQARQAQLEQIREQTEALGRQFDSVQKIVGADDVQQAEALNALEQALRNPAWQVLNAPLSDAAAAQLRGMQGRLQETYAALGGMASITPVGTPSGLTNVLDWARFTLPPHLRQELLDGLRENGPPAYQQILEDYYRSISKEK